MASDEIQALTVSETAKALRVSERHVAKLIALRVLPSLRHVAKLIALRVLPSLKLGRRRLIREVALRDFMQRQETVMR